MRIEAHDHLGKPIKANVTRVVIYDDYDNPVAIAMKYGQGCIYAGHTGDAEFQRVIKLLGIDKVLLIETLNAKELNDNPPRSLLV